MGKIIVSLRERLRRAEQRNQQLQSRLEKAEATTEYVAMMADVDIEEAEEDVREN